MSANSCLHAFVQIPAISKTAYLEAENLAASFSDSVQRIAPHLFYASLLHTHAWFESDAHLYEHVTNQENVRTQKAVLGKNLVHCFFYSHLISDPGIHVANTQNLRFGRMRKLISWRQWQSAAMAFVETLNANQSIVVKFQTEIQNFVQGLQALRIEKPAHVPQSISYSQLAQRFGVISAQLWLAWRNEDVFEWDLNKLPAELDFQKWKTISASVFPNSHAFSAQDCISVATETFFATLEKISNSNSLTIRMGILSFHVRLQCNHNLEFTSFHTLATPLYSRNKLSERIFSGCAQIIEKLFRSPQLVAEDGYHIERKPEWIESITIEPVEVAFDENNCQGIFQEAASTKLLEVENSLRSHGIGSVSRVPLSAQSTLYAHTHVYEPLLNFRCEHAFNFSLVKPLEVNLVKTEQNWDFWQVRIPTENRIFWMKTVSESRHLSFVKRNPIVLGICGVAIKSIGGT